MHRTTKLFIALLAAMFIGAAALFSGAAAWAGNKDGSVCNWSSKPVPVTVHGDGGWNTTALQPGSCWGDWNAPAVAVWGRICSAAGECGWQVWSVGSGSFWLRDAAGGWSSDIWKIRIDGWGWDSGWVKNWDTNWPTPWPWMWAELTR